LIFEIFGGTEIHMYAIVEVGGMQYKIADTEVLKVPLMEAEAGKSVVFDQVLLLVDGQNVRVGKPVLDDVKVEATVISHGKDDKVLIFKKKRRKRYRVFKGHRQNYTEIRIDAIRVSGAKASKPTEAPKQAKKKADSPTKKAEG
jgi:large subunit ribosomal protein L21